MFARAVNGVDYIAHGGSRFGDSLQNEMVHRAQPQVLQKLMRHSDIRTTMDYYANVEAAVEEAVFGPEVNSLRNSGKSEAGNERAGRDANTEGDGRSDAKR